MPHSHIWGIDIAVTHLEFAYADINTDRVDVETLITRNDETEGNRLGLIDRQVRIFARQHASRYSPYIVFVEQPSGIARSLQLVYVCGVVQAALAETLDAPVWTISSGKWKKWSIGHGNATKPQIRAWADAQGFDCDVQDQADACGIAHAGRLITNSGQWDAKEAA